MRKGSKMTIEAIAKIKASKQTISEDTRQLMREAKIGKKPWNAGLTKDDPRVANNTRGGWTHSEDTRQIMRDKKLGKKSWNTGLSKATDDRVRTNANKLLGIPKSIETKRLISESKKGIITFNKGLTKETSEIVRKYSEKASETIKKQFEEGRKIWCEGLTRKQDNRLTGNKYAEGNTKDTLEKIRIAGEKQRITKIELFNNGKLVMWNKGLTKETHPSMQNISEARIKYIMEHKNHASTYISKREILFKEWFIELGLVEDEDFIHQYFVKDIEDKYLADFLFPKLNLIIEFDGEYIHRKRGEVDDARMQQMRDKGFVILRFLEKDKKNKDKEISYAKDNIMKIIKYLIEEKWY